VEILVIGGGRFAGRHFVELAAANGHKITAFNRGKSSLPTPEGVEAVHGDRETDLAKLDGRAWDAVVDMCGYVPRIVKLTCDALKNRTNAYLFISTISVYADTAERIDEDSPRESLADPTTETVDGETSGGLKALCEDVVLDAFGEDALLVRPGMIVGPLDPTDRLTWWLARAAQGGRIPAIGAADSPMQYIDARDLAAWMLHALESGVTGKFNLTGQPTTLGETLAPVATGEIVYVSQEEAKGRGVEPDVFAWSVPDDRKSIWDVDIDRALAAGLKVRPIAETVRDTVAWHRTRDGHEWKAGLTPDQEQKLLA
jgi:2'-hydroxyisoflavone reductase